MTTNYTTRPRRAPTTDEVAGLCVAVAAAVADYGDPRTRDQDAEAIRAEAAGISEGSATAVVAGEKKSGKSSLINALVEWPGLLPVDADVATSVHISVGYDDEAAAQVQLKGAAAAQPIGLSEIAGYAALDPETGEPTRDDVEFVSVVVPAPLLKAGLELTDTPGVGGLVAGHAHITRALLRRADALLFVVSAANELTQSELDFLVDATKRIATVVFILTKTDTYQGWREILVKNQALLARHAPEYSRARWFAVSSRAEAEALKAAAAGNEDLAARRREQGGCAGVREYLESQVAAQAQRLRMRNALHVARRQQQALVRDQERRVRTLSLDPSLDQELAEQEARLRDLRGNDAKWRRDLAGSLRDLDRDLKLTFGRSVNDIRALADNKLAEASEADIVNELPGDIEAAVRGAWLELDNAASAGINRIIRTVSREIGEADIDASTTLTLPARLQRLPKLLPSANDSKDFLASVERAAPTLGMSALAGAAVAAITASVALPVLAGLATLAALSNRRKKREALQRARSDAAKYVTRVVGELSAEVPPQIGIAVDAVGGALAEAISEHVRQRELQLEAERSALKESSKLAKEQLARDRAAAQRQLGQLRDLYGEVIAMIADIDAENPGA